MIQLLSQYLYIFLHPFQIQDDYGKIRMAKKIKGANVIPFTLPIDVTESEIENIEELDEDILLEEIDKNSEGSHVHAFSKVEGIAISWAFAAIMGFYELLVINLSLMSFNYFSTDSELLASHLIEKYTQSTQGIFIFLTLINVVIFPMTILVYLKFWEVMIRFFAQVFTVEDGYD